MRVGRRRCCRRRGARRVGAALLVAVAADAAAGQTPSVDDARRPRGASCFHDRLLELPRPRRRGRDDARRRRPRPVARRAPARPARTTSCRPAGCRSPNTERRSRCASRPAYDDDEIARARRLRRRRSATARRSPTSTSTGADLAAGGELFRANCRAVPQRLGRRRRAQLRRAAPPLRTPTPQQVGGAVRVGPGPDAGVRPRRARPTSELDDVAALRRVPARPRGPGRLPDRPHRPDPRGLRRLVVRHRRAAGARGLDRHARADAPAIERRCSRRRSRTGDADATGDAEARGRRGGVLRGAARSRAIGARPSSTGTAARPSSRALLLAVVTGGIGVGIVVWAKHDDAARRGRPRSAEPVDVDRGGGRGVRRRLRGRRGERSAAAGCCSGSLGAGGRGARRRAAVPDPLARPPPGTRASRRRRTPTAADPRRDARTASRCRPDDLASTASSPSGPRATPTPPTRRRC